MPASHSDTSAEAFRRAVEALCLSQADVARELGISPAALDGRLRGASLVPAAAALALVSVLKAREVTLEQAASALYEHAMLRLTADRVTGPAAAAPGP